MVSAIPTAPPTNTTVRCAVPAYNAAPAQTGCA